jgi:Tfp pilus assembly protein PilF
MKRRRSVMVAAAAAIALGIAGCATQEAPEGHSAQARLGKVNFPVSCSAEAQREFNTAVAYYHSFAWAQVREPLERVLRADPNCGMAHWLRALASLDNPFIWPGIISQPTLASGSGILDTARKTGLKSQRERDYVDALDVFFKDHGNLDHRTRAKALETALERVMQRYPEDEEAAILYALVLSANFDPTDRKYTNQLKAAQVLEPIFKQQPQHPGVAHYLIHSYDYPPIASQGLDAARRYSKIAPDAAHALHMPSHIFTRVGAWKESIESNRESARAGSDKTFDKWHAYDYMVYAHLQLGQDRAAHEVVREALNNPARVDHVGTAYAYAAMPARLAIERAAWKEAASAPLFAAETFPWKKYPFTEAINAYARGIGAAMSGDAAGARAQADRLQTLRGAMKVPYWVEEMGIQTEVVRGLALCAEGNRQACIDTLRAAAAREDATEKHAVTPGRLVPAREMLAYVTLESGDAAAALREFETVLQRDPNRLRAFAGAARAAERAGDKSKAAHYSARLVELTESADTQLAEVAHARRLLGK